MILIVMGVSGCGKSSIGRLLAKQLHASFLEGDEFHSPENVAKMASGIPLTDEDRLPWLQSLNDVVRKESTPIVLSCSALKEAYRNQLIEGVEPRPIFVYLQGSFEVIYGRMQARSAHFMPPELLQSQFDTLEEPADCIQISVELSPEEMVQTIIQKV